MARTHIFTKREEIVNAFIHGVGAALSVAALVILIVSATLNGSTLHVVSFTLFGSTMTLLYLSSTLAHAFSPGRAKRLFEIFDHASIYLFIAGTYTPITLHVIGGTWGWTLFGIVWGCALVGTVFKAYFVDRFLYTSTLLYVLMGWLVVLAWGPLTQRMPADGFTLLLAGGISYTLGTVFYVWRAFPYHHAVWHVFVLAGSACHYFAILFFTLPR